MVNLTAEALIKISKEYTYKNDFIGIPPVCGEAFFSAGIAKRLKDILEF